MTRKPPRRSADTAVWVLKGLGTPDELRQKIQTAKDLARVTCGAIEYDQERLDGLIETAETAAATLEYWGISYDPETRRATIPAGKKGGAPQEWINYLIGNAAEDIQKLRRRDGNEPLRPQDLRDKVAHKLRPFGTPEELDASPRGKVEQAIRARCSQRAKLIAEIEQLAPSAGAVTQLILDEAFPFAHDWRAARIEYLWKLRDLAKAKWSSGAGTA